MTIADDIFAAAQTAFRWGTGPEGMPWCYDPVLEVGHSLLTPIGMRNASLAVSTAFTLSSGRVPGDAHVRTAMGVLLGLAQRSAPLPEITEAMVPRMPDIPAGAIDAEMSALNGVDEVLSQACDGRHDLFLSGTCLMRVTVGDDKRVVIAGINTGAQLAVWCKDAGIQFYVTGVDEDTGRAFTYNVYLPLAWREYLLAQASYPGVLPIAGVSRVPVVCRDGSVVSCNGYSVTAGLYLDIDEDLLEVVIPEAPTPEEVVAAVEYILGVYAGFPWADAASLANALGLLMTAGGLASMFPEMHIPGHAVSAPTQSSGKSLVGMDLPGLVCGGAESATYPRDDDEVRKRVTATLLETSARVVCWDNIAPGMVFESSSMAQMLTAKTWQDRRLGKTEAVSAIQDRVWTVTGNNLRLGPDMLARMIPILLDPRVPRPAAREFTLRLDSEEQRAEIRRPLIEAVLTVLRAWALAGCPESDTTAMRQFTAWARRCGGLLEFMGIEGHLSEPEAMSMVDDDIIAMAVLLEFLEEGFQGGDFTTADVVNLLDRSPEMDEVLPSWIAEHCKRIGSTGLGSGWERMDDLPKILKDRETLARSIGNTFKNRRDQFYGPRCVRRKADRRNGRNVLWSIENSEIPPEEGVSSVSMRLISVSQGGEVSKGGIYLGEKGGVECGTSDASDAPDTHQRVCTLCAVVFAPLNGEVVCHGCSVSSAAGVTS